MSQLTRQRVRLAVDAASFDQVMEVTTAAAPVIWRGDDVGFEVGVFWNQNLVDISNFASMRLEVLAYDEKAEKVSGDPLMAQTVSGSDLNVALDAGQWEDKSSQHALFAFTGAETALDLGGELKKIFFLALYGLTVDVPVRRVTFGSTLVRIQESGASGVPPVTAENHGSYRVKNGNEFQLKDSSLGQWCTLTINNGVLNVGEPEI